MLYESKDHGGVFSRIVPVDKHMSQLTLSLSGDKSDEELLDITLQDPTGSFKRSDSRDSFRGVRHVSGKMD